MDAWQGTVAGVVLAGGLSTRMGREKALLRVHGPDRPDMLARTHGLLLGLLGVCWVSCRPERAHQGYDCLFDARAGQGPAAGVQAALRRAGALGYAAVLALSCDLPFMDAPTLRALLAARAQAPKGSLATLYAAADSGRVEALSAVYEAAALPLFDAALAGGARRLSAVIPPEQRHVLVYSAAAGQPFFNLNRPEDLARAGDMLSSG